MKKVIVIQPRESQQIAKDLGKSIQFVNKALRYDSNSPLARMIRGMAIERGGKLLVEAPREEVRGMI
ncbi:MAG: hypothetical protein ACK5JU_12490 [Bacteroidales bacterium]